MQQRVAQAQLKGQLAEVGSDAIAGKRQPVASVPHKVRTQKRLRGIVGKRKQHLGTSHEGAEHRSMCVCVPKMSFSTLGIANRIAAAQREQDE